MKSVGRQQDVNQAVGVDAASRPEQVSPRSGTSPSRNRKERSPNTQRLEIDFAQEARPGVTLPPPLRNEIRGGQAPAAALKGTWPPSKCLAAAASGHDQDLSSGGDPAAQLGQGNRGGRLRFAGLLDQIPKPPPGAGR